MSKNSLESTTSTFDSLYAKYGKDKKIQCKADLREGGKRLNNPFLHFDLYLGGGPPRGQIVTYSGLFSTGKTTAAMSIAGANPGIKIGFVDGGFNWLPESYEWAEKYFGIKPENLVILQPDFIEEAGEMIYDTVPLVDLIIFDEFDLLAPESEYSGAMTDQQMGAMARSYKKFFRKTRGQIYRHDTACIITNHLYDNIGNVFEPLAESGGKGIKDYPAQKLYLSQSKDKDTSKEVIGQKITAEVKKDKVSGNFGKKFTLYYENGKGFNYTREVLDLGEEYGVIEKSGSWYSFDGDKIGQGAVKSCDFLKDNPELCDVIKTKIKAAYNDRNES